jgi:hypothetical protein
VISPQGGSVSGRCRTKARELRASLRKAGNRDQKFELLVLVGKDGGVQDAHTEQMPMPVGLCVMKALYDSGVKKETLFRPPPRDSCWLIVGVDSATIAASVK